MRYLVPAFAVLVLAGCGGTSHKLASGGAPSLSTTCGTLPARLAASTYFLKTGDGVRIYAASAGLLDVAPYRARVKALLLDWVRSR